MLRGGNNTRVMAQLKQPFINDVKLVETFSNEDNIFWIMKFRAMNFPSHISAVRAFAKSDSRWEPMRSRESARRPIGAQGEGCYQVVNG